MPRKILTEIYNWPTPSKSNEIIITSFVTYFIISFLYLIITVPIYKYGNATPFYNVVNLADAGGIYLWFSSYLFGNGLRLLGNHRIINSLSRHAMAPFEALLPGLFGILLSFSLAMIVFEKDFQLLLKLSTITPHLVIGYFLFYKFFPWCEHDTYSRKHRYFLALVYAGPALIILFLKPL